MILGMMLAAAVGLSQTDYAKRVDTALGDLAYTVGACQAVLPDEPADDVVMALTGADQTRPTSDQQEKRALFSDYYREGQAHKGAANLSSQACSQAIGDLTDALHRAAAEKPTI